MTVFEIILIGLSVSLDSFAVSLSKGLSLKENKLKTAFVCGLWFSLAQILMQLAGFFLGELVGSFINKYDHWISFIVLAFLGSKMMADSLCENTLSHKNNLSFKTMFVLSVATNIDTFAIGLSFSIANENIIKCLIIIEIVTFALSFLGAMISSKLKKHSKLAMFLGGCILAIIAIKNLVSHLFF